MPKKTKSAQVATDLSLKDAAKKTKQVNEEIVVAEEELTVAHAVLDKHIPENANEPDVRQAVEATEQVKKRLRKSVKELATVQATLEKKAAEQA
ncbi:hypothetical protein [Variovorax sp. HJSM1_2]|uniref:hypothetical protein n=1 Tax=Variovorax sp. HJSM1_2 TaxID=3366263 RepID=UPI003BC2205D